MNTRHTQDAAKMQHSAGHHGGGNPSHGEPGHDHHRMMIADFEKRFWVSLVLTFPILALSDMVQTWAGVDLEFPGETAILFVLATIVFFFGGWPFLKGLVRELKVRAPGMMTLIGIAVTVAYVFSSAVVLGFPGEDFFWELATLIDIMLLGHWIEMKSILGASRALELLVSMMPSEAHRVLGDKTEDVRLESLRKDDIILVKPGEKVPADGRVIDGESHLNESMLTGESKPAKKKRDDRVIGGSINGNGSLRVKVSHTGKDSYLNKVIQLVQEAQKAKSKSQHLADRAARWLTYISVGAGVGTLLIWLLSGQTTNFAIERMVSVMVISCPHALGLAVPLVVAISTTLAAQNGLLIRNRTAFENSRRISTIVFDKTGTLTKGVFGVTRLETLSSDIDEEKLLSYAAALEQSSEHPIGVGIVKKSKEKGISLLQAEKFNAITGKGVEAIVGGVDVKVVSPGYLKEHKISLPPNSHSDNAETVVFVLIADRLAGLIALADEIRPESADAVRQFKKAGIKVEMATGDNETVAKAVAENLGLNGFYAEVLPHQKVDIVKRLQQQGEYVAMTGDGVNDAPALAQADVGIAVGSGTDVAAETADIILVNSNPQDILQLILFGRATYNKMMQNLAWATGYNIIAIPLAAGIMYKAGFVLNPAIGAIFMSLSTVIVAFNAQLLRTKMNTPGRTKDVSPPVPSAQTVAT